MNDCFSNIFATSQSKQLIFHLTLKAVLYEFWICSLPSKLFCKVLQGHIQQTNIYHFLQTSSDWLDEKKQISLFDPCTVVCITVWISGFLSWFWRIIFTFFTSAAWNLIFETLIISDGTIYNVIFSLDLTFSLCW